MAPSRRSVYVPLAAFNPRPHHADEPTGTVDDVALRSLASRMASQMAGKIGGGGDAADWDECGWHYTGAEIDDLEERMERVALYVLCLDSINFCFWPECEGEGENNDGGGEGGRPAQENAGEEGSADPDGELQYHHLASALARVMTLRGDAGAYLLSPSSLAEISPHTLSAWLAPGIPSRPATFRGGAPIVRPRLPLCATRARLLRELGAAANAAGGALPLVRSAGGSAVAMAAVLADLPGFRDVLTDPRTGSKVSFYKRAQIAAADLWASFRCLHAGRCSGRVENPCDFGDLEELTTFADYRVPQLLREEGVLMYGVDLARDVDAKKEISGVEEVLIRAATVVAVERLVGAIGTVVLGEGDDEGDDEGATSQTGEISAERRRDIARRGIDAVRVDWYLWQVGEKLESRGQMRPHHRTRTIFY